MSLRFRKSIKLGVGVRMTVGTKGASTSFGGKAGRYTVNTSGRRTTSVNLPSGLSYVESSSGRKQRAPRLSRPGAAATLAPNYGAPRSLPKPGFLASAGEKRYHEGVQAYLAGDMARAYAAFQAVSSTDVRNISDDFFAGLSAASLGKREVAIQYLERVVQGDVELPDDLQRKYLPSDRAQIALSVAITDRVSTVVGFDSLGATLVLAELYQEVGRREEAIGLIQQLAAEGVEDLALRLSLAGLLFDDGDHDGVVDVTRGVENVSDICLAMLHLKANALAVLGMKTAAHAAYATCLRRTAGRDAALVLEVRYDRATYFEAIGDHVRARSDWEKLYADAPRYRDVANRVLSGR